MNTDSETAIRHCARCEQEYDATIDACGDCGAALAAGPMPEPAIAWDAWVARGETVYLVAFQSEGAARHVESILREQQIPTKLLVDGSTTIGEYSGRAVTMHIVHVQRDDLERAHALLEACRSEARALDASGSLDVIAQQSEALVAERGEAPTATDARVFRKRPAYEIGGLILIAATFALGFAWLASSLFDRQPPTHAAAVWLVGHGRPIPIAAGLAIGALIGGALGIYVVRSRRMQTVVLIVLLLMFTVVPWTVLVLLWPAAWG